MKDVKRILVATDFTEESKAALPPAVGLAELTGAEIFLVHVVPAVPHMATDVRTHFEVPEYERQLRADAEKRLKAFAQGAFPVNVRVTTVIAHGNADEGILEEARKNSVDVIVLATHGRGKLRNLLFGSIAEKVVRLAPCPVLTVRPPP